MSFAELATLLAAPTPELWIEQALREEFRSTLLIDHANCEKKAAASAIAMMNRYSYRTRLCKQLSRIAREELRHFEQVSQLMERESIEHVPLAASRYAKQLHAIVASREPDRLVDLLLVSTLIEARSLERFLLLGDRLGGAMGSLYRRLAESERRHFEFYLDSAVQLCDGAAVEDRLIPLREREAVLATSGDLMFRFHSGPLKAPTQCPSHSTTAHSC